MFEMFDSSSPSVFTFHQRFEHLVKLFREQTIGGITNVYMRHATTVDEPDAAPAAKFNKSGNNLKIKILKTKKSPLNIFLRPKVETDKFFRR